MDHEERRVDPRYKIWLPARIEGLSDAAQLAIGHDLSRGGSKLVTGSKLEVGTPIVLLVRVPPDSATELRIRAHIKRCQVNELDPDGLWPVEVAIQFDNPPPEFERLVKEYLGKVIGKVIDDDATDAAPEDTADEHD